MFHRAHSILITCMDFRFVERIHQFFGQEQRLAGLYDHVSLAGSAKSLVWPNVASNKEFVLRHIELAQKLHHIAEVILVNHQNCGAYGDQDSQVQHETDLRKSRQIILKTFPELKVRLFYATLEEKGKQRKIDFLEIK